MKMRAKSTYHYRAKYQQKKGSKIDIKKINKKRKNDEFFKYSIWFLAISSALVSIIYIIISIIFHAEWSFCDTTICCFNYISSRHPIFTFLCKIFAILIIFIAALLGFSNSREENTKTKKKYTRIAVMLAVSSGFMSVDTISQGAKFGINTLNKFTGYLDLFLHLFGVTLFALTILSFFSPKIYRILADD